jgi:RND family efflux transporter MFP subunit
MGRIMSVSRNAVLTVVAALALAACQAETAPLERPARPVQVASVTYADAAVTRDFVGVIAPRTETDLAFRVAGKVVDRPVGVGDRVKAGDVIARLDAEDLNLQLESAEAEHAAATSSIAQATADLERFDALKERGHATTADFDRKQLARDEASARLERATRSLDLARRQVGYAELRTDVDGVITATAAEPGQVVAVGQPVATLAHLDGKEAVVSLPEDWFAVAGKAEATVTLWANGDRVLPARLRELSPDADPATRTYRARFSIDGADDAVAFGMTATVTLRRPGDGQVARLPLAAVLNTGKGPSVYVVDASSRLALTPVTVAAFTGDAALVTGGVSDGDKVVTLGVQKLLDGEHVRTIDRR